MNQEKIGLYEFKNLPRKFVSERWRRIRDAHERMGQSPYKHCCKNPQQNTGKTNLAAH